jgi:anthranilate synthase component 1
MYHPAFEEFKEKSKEGNLIPVYREILADLDTPVSAFMRINDGSHSYLLESVEGGEKWARYSFLGSNPSIVIKGNRERIEITSGGKKEVIRGASDPLEILKSIMERYKPVQVGGLPRFFGGAVGYLSYDMVRYFEEIPDRKKEGIDLPDLYFVITDTILIFDNINQTIKVVSNAHLEGGDIEKVYKETTDKIDRIIRKLRDGRNLESAKKINRLTIPNFTPNMAREDFCKMVDGAKEYIKAGDIFQVVLSQRFKTEVSSDPFDIYRALRVINPSPYMYYLHFGDIDIAGSSPEVLVRCEDKKIEVRPIAGTRRRGLSEEEDSRMMEELLADPKERAEHIMLVDLGRNDVGRVSETGKVSVNELMVVEKYSHVMHMVSNVHGILSQDKDSFGLIKACFPAGTVSGAPKIRAMEIIDELEPSRRGIYAGAVGYFSFSGNMDTCIIIRTILIKDRVAYVQAGAGIVADSDPEKEYQETVNKAKAMVSAVEMAERGLL